MNEEELKEERNLKATLDMWENMEEEQRLKQLKFLINEGFQKGKLEQKKEELFYFQRAYLLIPMYKSKGKFYSIKSCDKLSKWIEKRIKQLQKEINSQTEQNSDKEVAQPYSKSDKTTKEIRSNSK